VTSPRPSIALDARKLAHPGVGIGQYTLELARQLPVLAPEFEFRLLVDHPLGSGSIPGGCRQVVIGRGHGPDQRLAAKLYSPWWMNVLVTDYLKRAGVALFHGTNFAIPATTTCRSVTTIHDLAFLKVPAAFSLTYRLYASQIVRTALRRADGIVSVSAATKRDLVDVLGVRPDDVTVIHHGVGPEYSPEQHAEYLARVRGTHRLPHRFLLHVGMVQRRKNLDMLLRASAPLLRENIVDQVVLAGKDGPGADQVRRGAARLGVRDRVRFLGYVPPDVMPGLYRLAAVLVMPSLYEGFGMPVLEGMACGTPVVTSNTSSLPEVAGDAALLVPPGDPAALTAALRRLLLDQALASDLRSRGLRRASDFTWTESARRHLDVYRAVLEKSKRGGVRAGVRT